MNLMPRRKKMSITTELGEFINTSVLTDFPQEAQDAAKIAILDCIACMLAGSQEPIADILTKNALFNGGNEHSTVATKNFKTSAQEAALINGAMAHALDYDDVTEGIKVHPSVFLLPGALALGELHQVSGSQILLSYLIGFEVACSIGQGLSEAYFDDLGWHPTGPLGALGAGAAAAAVLGLSSELCSKTLSLSASQASGLRQNFGSMAKPFHPGLACKAGVLSAQLANSGFTADDNILEGRFGFLRAFSGGNNFNPSNILNSLKETNHMIESGVEIKKYPCCGSSHLSLDAMFKILADRKLEPADIDSITSWVDFDPPRSLVHSNPTSSLEGKFSMEYLLSAAIIDQEIGLDSFSDSKIQRESIKNLMSKVTMQRHPGNEGKQSWLEGYHKVEIKLKNGDTVKDVAERNYVGALRGVTKEDVIQKFNDCSSRVLPKDQAEKIKQIILDLENTDNIRSLTSLL